MAVDVHIHMVLDGADWRGSIARHRDGPDEALIRQRLALYRERGFTYLRDGGDRWGVGAMARALAPEYGITYRTPLAPLCRSGHYGGFIGVKFENLRDYQRILREKREKGTDFIKIMISGLMDFDRFGVLTEPGLDPAEIRDLIGAAHDAGFSVMAHANGAETVLAAAASGVDSVEHGAYLSDEALAAMAENGTAWVPTLSAIGNLRGTGRFREEAVEEILASAQENVRRFDAMGGFLAPGSDAGAWAVPHGGETEYRLLEQALGSRTAAALDRGIAVIRGKF